MVQKLKKNITDKIEMQQKNYFTFRKKCNSIFSKCACILSGVNDAKIIIHFLTNKKL